jgi:RimJ/RimL family protein N-acetyltransferase
MNSKRQSVKIKEFNTERLILRSITTKEWQDFVIHAVEANEVLIQFAHELDEGFFERNKRPCYSICIYYSIHLPETDEMIGYVGFCNDPDHPCYNELEYYIFKPFRHRGYAYEAIGALIEKLFAGEIVNRRVEEVRASVVWENKPSMNLLRKLGFHSDGGRILMNDVIERCFSYTREEMEVSA